MSGETIVLNKSPIEIRVPDKRFHPYDSYVFSKRVLEWFKLYPYLDYYEIMDYVICSV